MGKQTDWQTDRQIDKQIDRWESRQIDNQMYRWESRQIDKQIDRLIDKQTGRWIDRQTDIFIDEQTGGWKNWKIENRQKGGQASLYLLYCWPLQILMLVLLFTENEDKKLWDPNFLSSEAVEEYLSKSEESLQTSGVISLPLGAHIRDDEQVRLFVENNVQLEKNNVTL
jgi:hypothetical protein